MSRERRRVTLPTIPDPDEWAYLDFAYPMTPGEWAQMLRVLEAMQPGLVRADEPPPAAVDMADTPGPGRGH